MSTIQLTASGLGRGRKVFVVDGGKNIPVATFLNQFSSGGLEFQATGTQGGDVLIEPLSEKWTSYSDIQRQTSMVSAYWSLVEAGVPEAALNYRSARRDQATGKYLAATQLYLNVNEHPDVFGASAGGFSQPAQKMDENAVLADLTKRFLAAGGDVTDMPAVPVPAVIIGWLQAQLDDAEPTEPEQDNAPEPVEAEVEDDNVPL